MAPQSPVFEPDSVPVESNAQDHTHAPATSSSAVLARYEIESGRGNEGTKILMLEWEDEDNSKSLGDWEVSWEGKSTVLSARDGADGKLHRLYFLLPPNSPVPRIIKLAQARGKTMQTNPLPAIFPAELGITARTAGRKGVLHTIWAKKRLSVLQGEIETEMKTNGEGVGLEMALQEKQWIEDNFGVGAKNGAESLLSSGSPRTPIGGRLSEKLKGLRLGTSATDLGSATPEPPAAPEGHSDAHPLSPDMSDVAVSSFSAFHGASSRPSNRAVAQSPPGYIVAQQGNSRDGGRMSSLDAITGGYIPKRDEMETEDGLFAVKMSPRSPEMAKSPFSFTTQDTAPWLKGNE
ncbi:hypothetical protein PVAG01_07150 [Phlyctema vagabunda]|uniref:Uncharacterized protein n=1 Tax=Phlyctema vagabunda TaxID=108571 RepID=A0ABR4PBL5_9HELO